MQSPLRINIVTALNGQSSILASKSTFCRQHLQQKVDFDFDASVDGANGLKKYSFNRLHAVSYTCSIIVCLML